MQKPYINSMIVGMKSSQKGFNLLELIVVIAIIAMFAVLVLSSLSKSRGAARDARRIRDIEEINKVLIAYYNDHNEYPKTPDGAGGYGWWSNCSDATIGGHGLTGSTAWIPNVAPTYISTLSNDPSAVLGSGVNCINYRYKSNGVDYKLRAAKTAETICPKSGDKYYDIASPSSWCSLVIYTPGAEGW